MIGCHRWNVNAAEPPDALESPIQWKLYGKIIGGDPVIRIVLP